MAETKIRVSTQLNFDVDTDINGIKLTNVADPTAAQDVATKNYVDAKSAGFDWKASVRVASTGNLTLSGAQTIDGVSVIAGDRVLAKDQTTAADRGIYVCAAGAWARSADANTSADVTSGMAMFVSEGTANAGTNWVLTTPDPITLGSTALTFTQTGTGTTYGVSDASLTLTGTNFKVTPGTSAQVLLNTGTVMTPTTVSGDATISSSGVLTNGSAIQRTAGFADEEVPSGTVNSSNVTFTLAHTPNPAASLKLFKNGDRLKAGGNDYTLATATITFVSAPKTGDTLLADYRY